MDNPTTVDGPRSLRAGSQFGRYRLEELLGRGGMGEVWRAHDTAIDRVVALKVLPANFADDPVFQERFRREAHAAAGLDEPHVVPIYDFGEIDGRLFVIMRLIKGRDLQTILAEGPLPPPHAVAIIEQVAQALHAAHRVGLVHRDIKPSNILLGDNDFAYLIDFGIARAAGETGLTSTGMTIGTWSYMAPERFRSGTTDARADIYALACVLYETLTGRPPFPGDSLEQIAIAHMVTPPPRPSREQDSVPAAMDHVIATGMAKGPDQRYASTIELADAAREAVTVPMQRPAPSPAPHRPLPKPPASPVPTPANAYYRRPQTPPSPWSQAAAQLAPKSPAPYAPHYGSPVPQIQRNVAAMPLSPRLPTPTRAGRVSRRTRIALIGGAVALVAVIAAAVGILAIVGSPTSSEQSYAAQIVLPFTGLKDPAGVAVDSGGNLYITDSGNNRVLKLPADSVTQQVLPFPVSTPFWVAVDSGGNLYVTERSNSRVLKLSADSATQQVLPFTGLKGPTGVAVDAEGNVYVNDRNPSGGDPGNRVLKLATGAKASVLPFTDLSAPAGVAVDSAGNLYVADSSKGRVLKLPAGSATQEVLPLSDLKSPAGVAVDSAGNLYVTDRKSNRVLKLPAGSATQEVLPFTGLNDPKGVAVDYAGNLYVADGNNDQVLKLPSR